MTVVVLVSGALIVAGAVLAMVRAERGPSMLDRTVALDIVVTCLVAAVALYAALERRADVVPVLVVLSLVGFVGSVTIARFAALEPEDAGRLRTREEVEAERAARTAAELALLETPPEGSPDEEPDGPADEGADGAADEGADAAYDDGPDGSADEGPGRPSDGAPAVDGRGTP